MSLRRAGQQQQQQYMMLSLADDPLRRSCGAAVIEKVDPPVCANIRGVGDRFFFYCQRDNPDEMSHVEEPRFTAHPVRVDWKIAPYQYYYDVLTFCC